MSETGFTRSEKIQILGIILASITPFVVVIATVWLDGSIAKNLLEQQRADWFVEICTDLEPNSKQCLRHSGNANQMLTITGVNDYHLPVQAHHIAIKGRCYIFLHPNHSDSQEEKKQSRLVSQPIINDHKEFVTEAESPYGGNLRYLDFLRYSDKFVVPTGLPHTTAGFDPHKAVLWCDGQTFNQSDDSA